MKNLRPLSILALFLITACNGEGRDPSQKDSPDKHVGGEPQTNEIKLSNEALELAGIRLAQVERRALSGGTTIPAEIQFEPSSTAHVGPLVAGRITKVTAGLGDRVKKGQPLATIASSDVSQARARLDQARARLQAAESTRKRQQQLSSEGIGAQRSLIDAEAQVGELTAEVEGLRQQLSLFGSGSSGEITLTSPIDGVIVAVHGTLGETAAPEEPTFVVTDPTKVWVRGNVPELDIATIQLGSSALVRLHAFSDLKMKGTVNYIAPALDERTRSLPIRVTLETPDSRLRSGLFGSIEMLGNKSDEHVLVVPIDAVATLDGQNVVFIPGKTPNSFVPQPVKLGRRSFDLFEVQLGLAEGDTLCVGGTFTLKSAMKIHEFGEEH